MDSQRIQLPDNRQVILTRFIEACEADERIVAAFLGGSYANGTADKFSDLDLLFITTDEAYKDFLVEREAFIRRIDKPLFMEDYAPYPPLAKTYNYP